MSPPIYQDVINQICVFPSEEAQVYL